MNILLDSVHPIDSGTLVYTYTVPAWSGTHTIYATFSLDTYAGPVDWGGSIVVSTNLGTQTFTGNSLAGMTVALSSSDGVLTVTVESGYDFYGFALIDCNIEAPYYLIGNPNSEDDPEAAVFESGDAQPMYVHTSVDPDFPLSIRPAKLSTSYSYPFVFNADLTAVFSLVAGAVPTGLVLGPSGLLAGTPLMQGRYNFTVKAHSPVLGVDVYGNYILDVVPPAAKVVLGRDFGGTGTWATGDAIGQQCSLFKFRGQLFFLGFAKYNNSYVSGMRMYKSTDDGVTWAVLDQANEPPLPAHWTGGGTFGAVMASLHDEAAGLVYFVVITDYTASTFGIMTFDLVTEAWSAVPGVTLTVPASLTYLVYPTFGHNAAMVKLSNGNLRIFFYSWATSATVHTLAVEDDAVPTVPAMFFTDYDGASFTAPLWVTQTGITGIFQDFGPVVHQPESFVGGGTIDVTHIWYVRFSPHYVRVDASGVGSAPYTANMSTDFVEFVGSSVILEPLTNSMVLSSVVWTATSDIAPGVFRATPLESPVWTKEIVVTPNANDLMYKATRPSYCYIFRAADGRQAVIYVGGHNTEDVGSWDTYFIQYYDPVNPALGWTAREEVTSMFWNPIADAVLYRGDIAPEWVWNSAGFDETPYQALADPTGGFYFVFMDDNVGTAMVMHYPPRTLGLVAAPVIPAEPYDAGIWPESEHPYLTDATFTYTVPGF